MLLLLDLYVPLLSRGRDGFVFSIAVRVRVLMLLLLQSLEAESAVLVELVEFLRFGVFTGVLLLS